MLLHGTVLLLHSRWQQHHKIQKNKINWIHAVSENATPSSFWRLKLERLKCRFPVGISHHKRRKKALTVIVKYHVQLQVKQF